MDAKGFGRTLLFGMSQVMLQKNEITGALFLLGIFANSLVMFYGAALGVLAGTLAGMLLGGKKEHVESGLYGFNGALVGIALFFFLVPDAAVLVFIVTGAAISSLIMREFLARKLPAYTFPFVLATWIVLAAIYYNGFIAPSAAAAGLESGVLAIDGALSGLGQVMFQQSVLTGVLFLAGLLAASRNAALFGLAGSVAGMAIGALFSSPAAMLGAGILGYNGALCGIAFCGEKRNAVPYALAAIAASVLILVCFQWAGIPALTAPFVFATWVVLAFAEK